MSGAHTVSVTVRLSPLASTNDTGIACAMSESGAGAQARRCTVLKALQWYESADGAEAPPSRRCEEAVCSSSSTHAQTPCHPACLTPVPPA
eukprot:352813-Chlamydomonas_euryale.AAC.1